MTNITWRVLLHATDGDTIGYSLSSMQWQGPARTHGRIELLSNCRPDQLHAVLDDVADYVLHQPPLGQDPLPFETAG